MLSILKKTTQQIIASGHDFLITAKGNQQTLLRQLETQFEHLPPLRVDHQSEWNGLVRVERTGTRADKPYNETMFYISSLTLDAVGFAQKIREHWHIENRLHWVKDVVLKEDESPLCDGNAPVNFGIVRTLGLILFRVNGFDPITRGLRFLAHDVQKLFSFFHIDQQISSALERGI